MKQHRCLGIKATAGIVFFSLFLSGGIYGLDKKLQVVSDTAEVRLNPDAGSPLVGTLLKGSFLTLNSASKQKNTWYYVSFKSEITKITKSGYIRENDVECLFAGQKIIDISGGDGPADGGLGPVFELQQRDLGVKKDNFLKKEGEPARQEHVRGLDILGYQKKIMGRDCAVEYLFSAGLLVQVRLDFLRIYQDKGQSIKIYEDLKSWLAQTFGQPENDIVRWQNPAFKYDSLSWGHAVSQGHLEYNALWQTSKSEINLNLSGANNEIFLKLDCTEKAFKNLANRGD